MIKDQEVMKQILQLCETSLEAMDYILTNLDGEKQEESFILIEDICNSFMVMQEAFRVNNLTNLGEMYKQVEEPMKVLKETYDRKNIQGIGVVLQMLVPQYTIWTQYVKEEVSQSLPVKLHLGCGRNILDGWINLDITDSDGVDVIADLDNCRNEMLPFLENSIDEFYASHLIEHLKNPLPFMEELYRVAKPDAKALFRVPYGSSDDAYEDPTHVKRYFLNSFSYFSQPLYWRADYGYRGDWQVVRIDLVVSAQKYKDKPYEQVLEDVHTYRNIVKEMIVELKAVKPIREPRQEFQLPLKINILYN